MGTLPNNPALTIAHKPVVQGGLPVRTNLRAGLAWDDIDDRAQALWGKLTNAVSNATNALTAGSDTSKPTA